MGNKLMKHRMSRLQRAKQFMPFAALRGFEALLSAVARPKEARVELSEDQIDELNPWWKGILYECFIIQVIAIRN